MNTTIDILPEDYAGLEGENESMRELYVVKYALARVSGYDVGRLCEQAREDVVDLEHMGYKFQYLPPRFSRAKRSQAQATTKTSARASASREPRLRLSNEPPKQLRQR